MNKLEGMSKRTAQDSLYYQADDCRFMARRARERQDEHSDRDSQYYIGKSAGLEQAAEVIEAITKLED